MKKMHPWAGTRNLVAGVVLGALVMGIASWGNGQWRSGESNPIGDKYGLKKLGVENVGPMFTRGVLLCV